MYGLTGAGSHRHAGQVWLEATALVAATRGVAVGMSNRGSNSVRKGEREPRGDLERFVADPSREFKIHLRGIRATSDRGTHWINFMASCGISLA